MVNISAIRIQFATLRFIPSPSAADAMIRSPVIPMTQRKKFRALPPREEESLAKLALWWDSLCWGLAILGILYVMVWRRGDMSRARAWLLLLDHRR